MASEHNRRVDRCGIGTTLTDPNINTPNWRKAWASKAKALSLIPKDLAPAIARGVAAAKRGEPYLIDVVTQGR